MDLCAIVPASGRSPSPRVEAGKDRLALILAAQEAKNLDSGLFADIANYHVLLVTDADARAMARNVAPPDQERRVADWLKNLPRFGRCSSPEASGCR